jgi:hypothetical protein
MIRLAAPVITTTWNRYSLFYGHVGTAGNYQAMINSCMVIGNNQRLGLLRRPYNRMLRER